MAFIRNNLFVSISNIGTKIHTFFLMGILINFISLNCYSEYIIITSVVTFLTGISNFGVGFYYKRYLPSAVNYKTKRELFIPQFFYNLIFSLFIIILLLIFKSELINKLFDKKIATNYLLIPLYFISYVLYTQTTDYFRYSNRMSLFSLFTLVTPYI
jgi:O-antigen/teichoic acid export membrane protein